MINKKISHSVSFLLIFSISNLSLIGTTFANPVKTLFSIGGELNTLFKKVNPDDTKNFTKLLEKYPTQPLSNKSQELISNTLKKKKGYKIVGYGTLVTISSDRIHYLCTATQCLVKKEYNECSKSSPSLTPCLSKPLNLNLSKPLKLRNINH